MRVGQPREAIGVTPAIDVAVARQQLRELLERAALRVEIGERADVLVVVAEAGDDLAPQLDGAPDVADALPGHGRHLDQVGANLVRGRRALDPPAQQVDDRRPSFHADQQLARGGQRLDVARIQREPGLPGAERPVDVAELQRQLGGERPGEALRSRLRLDRRQPLQGVEPFRLVAEPVVDLLETAKALEPQLRRAGLAGDGVLEQRARRLGASELPILDPRRADQQLGATFGRPAGRRRRRQPRRQPGRIARGFRQLPQAVLDGAVLGGERDERDILIEGARDVAARIQAVAAFATQIAEALSGGEVDGGQQQLRNARAGARRLVAHAQSVERVEAGLGRRALVGEQVLEQQRQRRVLVQIGEQHAHLGERRVGLGELLLQRRGDAEAQLARLAAGDHLQPESPDRDQLGPALVPFQQPLERGGDLPIGGTEAQQLFEVADRARRDRR